MENKAEDQIKREKMTEEVNKTKTKEEKLIQHITIVKNEARFEDIQTFFQKYNLEMPIQNFLDQFENICNSFEVTEKQKTIFLTKLVSGPIATFIKSKSIPRSFIEFKLNLVREFGTQINPAEIHLQLAKTEKTSKETNIEYFYRMQEIASRINLEEEAENFYIIKGLKEDRAIEMQLKSSKDIQELKENMKILDIQESKISTTNRPEFINPKYPLERTPPRPTQLGHRSQYRRWRSGQNQPPNELFPKPSMQPGISSTSNFLSSSPTLYSSAADHVPKKSMDLATKISGIATRRSNFPSQSQTTRKQYDNSTISKMRSSHHPSEHQFKEK
ncbi:hypothetical protein TNCT_428731 [Trichonephila clavata]|uniref:Retrotransposon gag domain-containing protein n=1 Tax=Trichonephila clavata TaxID=2740835 RepID=A0A8X6JCF9_TRICU|nr:hypothetical protein TNCT_428731 [Trichonephila clavata]